MNARDRTLVGVALVVILAVGGWFLLVAPKRKQARSLQAQITSQEAALAPSGSQIAAALRAKHQYAALTRQLAALQIAIPADDQVPQLINDLQGAATRVRLTFSEISAGATTSSTGSTTASAATASAKTTGSGTTASSSASDFPSEQFSLTFDGRYKGVMDLMGDLTKFVKADNAHFAASGRLIVISTVSITSTGRKTVSADVDVTDYDIPSALAGTTSSGTTATTGTPAADIIAK